MLCIDKLYNIVCICCEFSLELAGDPFKLFQFALLQVVENNFLKISIASAFNDSLAASRCNSLLQWWWPTSGQKNALVSTEQ
jgi:hypothetical protein